MNKIIWLDKENNVKVTEGHYTISETVKIKKVKGEPVEIKTTWLNKEWKPGHWQAHIITPEGKAMQLSVEEYINERDEELNQCKTRRERWAVKQKLFFPTELLKHTVFKIPKSDDYDIKTRPVGMENSIKWMYKSDYSLTVEDIEDAFMDALWNAQLNRNFKKDNQIYGHTKTLKYRKSTTNLGKTQRGQTPLKGIRPHIGNIYSRKGENLIEQMGYDYKDDLIIGSNK